MGFKCDRLKLLPFGILGVLAIWLCFLYAPVNAMAYGTDSTDGHVAYTADEYGNDKKDFYDAQEAISDSYNTGRYVFMCSDWVLGDTLVIPENKTVRIYMFGHKIEHDVKRVVMHSMHNVIKLCENAKLYLLDHTPNMGFSKTEMSYDSQSSGNLAIPYYSEKKTLLTSGLVTGSRNIGSRAGGVWMEDYSCLYLRGVSIAGNFNQWREYPGGGVNMESGCRLIMENGAHIQDNYGYHGGGVGAKGDDNHIELYGGSSIEGNTANDGGGVYAKEGGTRIRLENKSKISNNVAGPGAGVLLEGGWNTISSEDKTGIVENNHSQLGDGGAVDLHSCGKDCGFYGITFTGNKARFNGGALFVSYGSGNGYFTIQDCTITNNQCGVWGDGEGGGVYVDYDVDVKLENKVIIKDNVRYRGNVSDDLFLADKYRLFCRSHAYIIGGASEGSDVRVRTGMTEDQRIGKNINTYTDGIYKMDIGSYWVTKGDDCGGDLWQRCS